MHHPLTLCHVGIFLNESPVPRHSFASRTRDKAYGSICRRFTEYPELLHPHTYARMNARDSVWEDRLRYVGNVGPCTPAARAHVCGGVWQIRRARGWPHLLRARTYAVCPAPCLSGSETRRPERGRSGWNVRRIDRPTGPPFVCPSYIPKRLTLTGRLRGARRSDNAVRLWVTLSIPCRYLSISIPQRPKMASKNKEAVDNSQKRDADGMPMNHDGQ